MKILVLSDLWVPFPGGAERLMFNLARALEEDGDDVQVFTGYTPAKPFDGPPVEWGRVPEGENGLGDAVLAERIVTARPDVVLTHHYWALNFTHPIVTACDAISARLVQVVLNGRRLEKADLAVYISKYVRDQVGGAREQDLLLLPPALRRDVAAEGHEHAVGFIKPIHHKGVKVVYEIARRMPERQFVVLRGEWQNIEEIADLANVEYMEPVDDIRDFYRRVDVVLMPSLSEDAGTVAQECAANGIPCISSDVGGLAETNAGGLRIPSFDVDQWVQEIQALDHPERYHAVVASMLMGNPMSQHVALGRFIDAVHALGERL